MYPLLPAPVLVFCKGCSLNRELIGSHEITLPLAVLLSWIPLPIIISSGIKLPKTFSKVISTKSGNVTTTVGKDDWLYPDPEFDTETFVIPPEIVATAVAPDPDLVVPLSFGKVW